MNDELVIVFFSKLENTITKIKKATTTIQNAANEILDDKAANEILDDKAAKEILDDKTAKEILDEVVLLYEDHFAVFQYLFLKYKMLNKNKQEIFDEINKKLLEYAQLYVALYNLLIALDDTLLKLEKKLITKQGEAIKFSKETNKYRDICNYFVHKLSSSCENIQITHKNIFNNPSKCENQILLFQKLSTDNLKSMNETLISFKIKKFEGGRKNPTKQKPKGKHDDMTMKDIKELCKANQIKLSRVVEGKRIAYKKKELITKLKRKKLL